MVVRATDIKLMDAAVLVPQGWAAKRAGRENWRPCVGREGSVSVGLSCAFATLPGRRSDVANVLAPAIGIRQSGLNRGLLSMPSTCV